MKQILESQQTPHTSPARASYEVFFVNIFDNIDCVITTQHCASIFFQGARSSHNQAYWQGMQYIGIGPGEYILLTHHVVVTHKQLEQHGCVLSTMATDALVLKHQAISTHSADWCHMTSFDSCNALLFWYHLVIALTRWGLSNMDAISRHFQIHFVE